MMSIRGLIAAVPPFLLSLLLAACTGDDYSGRDATPDPAAAVPLDGVFETVRIRPNRDQIRFRGGHVWATGYEDGLFLSGDSGYTFERVSLPASGRIKALQLEAGGELGVVVTEQGVLMRTADAGETWAQTILLEHIGDGVDTEWGGDFENIQFDETLQNGMWIDFCQIFLTEDGGRSWTRHGDNLQDTAKDLRCVNAVVMDEATGLWLADVEVGGRILTSGSYLYRSDDEGASWSEVCSMDEVGLLLKSIQSCFKLEGLPPAWQELAGDFQLGDMDALAEVSDRIDQAIFVDGSLPLPDEVLDRLFMLGMVEDEESGRIWYDDGQRLAYTDDSGKRWQVVSSGMPGNEDMDFSFGASRGFAIYQYYYLAVSEDVGKTWKPLNSDQDFIYDFAVLPEHDRVVVATDKGLSVLDTETLDWNEVSGVAEANDLVVSGPVIWSFSGNGEVHRSIDAGSSWSKLPVDLENEYFSVERATCDADNCILFGSSEDAAVARLSAETLVFDFTELSEHISNLDEDYVVDAVFDADLNRGWLAMDAGRVFGTEDGGRSWHKLATLREEITEFGKSPGSTNLIARGYSNNYLWSSDGKEFERRRAPIGRNGYMSSLCWINDSVALLTAYNEDAEEEYFLASADGGFTWGPTSWATYDDDCVIRGGLVTLSGMIARIE